MKYHPDNLKSEFKPFLEEQKLSEATIRYYLSDIRVFLRFIYQISGDYEITSEMFQSYESFLKSGRLPTKTINRKLSSLRIFNTFLLENGKLKENIMRKVKNNKRDRQTVSFPFSTTPVLLIVFFVIIGVGAFLISTTRSDLFPSVSSFSPSPVTISKSIQTDAIHPPELLKSQSIGDISVEGNAPSIPASITFFGKATVTAGEKTTQVNVNLNTSNENVIITPTTLITGNYYVEEQKNYFVIHIAELQKNDVTFNWLVISNQLPVDKLPR